MFYRLAIRPPTSAMDLRNAQLVLDPEHGRDYVEAFGGLETMDTLRKLLNVSAEIVRSQLDVADEVELKGAVEVHHMEWQEAVYEVTRAYKPKGEIPLLFLAHRC